MPASKTARWLDLLAYLLQHRFAVTREQIFASVGGYGGAPESARRKFERDKDELRQAGIDIETVPLRDAAGDEPATGYRLRESGAYLPWFSLSPAGRAPERPWPGVHQVELSDDELRALDRATRRLAALGDSPFAEAARSARRKLSFDLPIDPAATAHLVPLPVPESVRQTLAVLQRAVLERRAVDCAYFTLSRNATARREIEPHGLFFQWGNWYCVARARDREAMRLFRVDRMDDARLLDDQPFEVPADFDIRKWMARAPWEMGKGPVTVSRVRFDFPVSHWVVSQGMGRQVESGDEEDGLVLEFDVRDRAAYLRWLLSFQREAELLDPPDLVAELASLRRRVADIYTDVPREEG